jgi:transmembrane sensor
MRKISRWYNVDVEFTNEQSKKMAYWGSVTRYSNVSKVLNQLEETGHEHFRIEGKKIIITKK